MFVWIYQLMNEPHTYTHVYLKVCIEYVCVYLRISDAHMVTKWQVCTTLNLYVSQTITSGLMRR